ncbi:hypothetical protein CTA2_6504 [Colletotrichum tanaceti]|nr:hypothetical protein CTA2_6504 [Colletotrichum tanaceti]
MSPPEEYDIVGYGSTSGAAATAIQAARLSRSVSLISPQENIVETSCRGVMEEASLTSKQAANLELHRRISAHYGRLDRLNEVVKKRLKVPEVWQFEASVAERIIREWLAAHRSIAIIKTVQLDNGRTFGGKVRETFDHDWRFDLW